MNALAHYRKAVTALVGAILTWTGAAYVPDGHVDRAEWYALAIALATAAGVYGVANGHPQTAVTPDVHPSLGGSIPQPRNQE